jgi:hypothetical protein
MNRESKDIPIKGSNNQKAIHNIKKYRRKINKQNCSICKLELRNKQNILQCKKCFSLFHQQHLKEWLNSEEVCPVCGIEMKF